MDVNWFILFFVERVQLQGDHQKYVDEISIQFARTPSPNTQLERKSPVDGKG